MRRALIVLAVALSLAACQKKRAEPPRAVEQSDTTDVATTAVAAVADDTAPGDYENSIYPGQCIKVCRKDAP